MLFKPEELLVFRRGEFIFQEGEQGDCGYVIARGEVEVYKSNRLRKRVLVSRLGAGELIGEIGLLRENAMRTASVVAFTDQVNVLPLPRDNYQQELATLSPAMRMVIQALVQRLNQTYTKIAFLS